MTFIKKTLLLMLVCAAAVFCSCTKSKTDAMDGGHEMDGAAGSDRAAFDGGRDSSNRDSGMDGNGLDGNGLDDAAVSVDCWATDGSTVADGYVHADSGGPDGTVQVCGNGAVEGTEACDDGNTTGGDYCSADCSHVTGYCGDGVLQTNESCDDGIIQQHCDTWHDGGDGTCAPQGQCVQGYVLDMDGDCVPELLEGHVYIDVDNFCISQWYEVDVWLSYGGGYLDLATGGVWDDSFEHCTGPGSYDAYADISTACSSYRLYIHCL